MSMSIYEIRREIAELEDKLSADKDNTEIKSRLHEIYCYENQYEEYSADIY